jgi:hypothetical protein
MDGLGLSMRGDTAMKKTNKSANLASRFRMTMYGIMLSSLLLAAACAEGGYQTYPAPSYPTYSYPEYYHRDYYGPSYYPERDPEYWRRWQDRQGGG